MAEVRTESLDQPDLIDVHQEADPSTLREFAAKWAGRAVTAGLVVLAKHYVESSFNYARSNNYYRRRSDSER